jgi:glutathione S-transferase
MQRCRNDLMSKSKSLIVWGVGTTRTMRVHWLLKELNLTYETHRIESRTGETGSAEFESLNPKKKIPALVDGDIVVTESMAIMRHLRRNYDTLGYDDYQLSIEGQCAYDEWSSFILMELDATSLYVIRRHKDLPEIYGEAENAVKSSIQYWERMINSVKDKIQGNEFIWGSCFSELDILMTICLDWASFVGVSVPVEFQAYHRALTARPAYQAAREINFTDLQIPLPK